MIGRWIHINGVVQGVGFRPFVYGLAQRHDLRGWVRNTSEGVDIRVDGDPAAMEAFILALRADAPPLAHIEDVTVTDCMPEDFPGFEIRHSAPVPGAAQPISPDVALCDDCRREMDDPDDRRYRYPFINCTNCGPRFTIITDIPYDRPQTTMRDFPMCDACAAEYHDPGDRRFHAQPVACPDCGPRVWMEGIGERLDGEAAIIQAIRLLMAGAIVAIKGLGGFHLACDATQSAAVADLRQRKQRPHKPFALMVGGVDMARTLIDPTPDDLALLTSPAAPIVLAPRRPGARISKGVAPRQTLLGVMLPYTPLHRLLFVADMPPLVMTSGNPAGEPVVTDNAVAKEQLGPLADALLLHDRDIHIRTDDSVMRSWRGVDLPVRRSRGYAPFPVTLPFEVPPLLATGAEMKNVFAVAKGKHATLSHHIGTMGSYATLTAFRDGIDHFERLFRIEPALIVHDMHPDYVATRYAVERERNTRVKRLAVQHHHAHIAACMAENGVSIDGQVLGICFDGTGYGPDGTIWGGEFLLADYRDFMRLGHFRALPLPGGDVSTRKPARIAYAYALACNLTLPDDAPPMRALPEAERKIIAQQVGRGINTPLTSSVGRLFDCVAAMIGICQVATYEGHAAIALEAAVDNRAKGTYPLLVGADGVIDPAPLLAQVLADWEAGISAGVIAARFHRAMAEVIATAAAHFAEQTGVHTVALSGGVFQNVTLLNMTVPLLEDAGLTVLTHQRVPPNDGGLALGQAIIGGATTARQ